MNFIAPNPQPLIREIPLSRLALAPENVRKTPPYAQADAELKASIAALGLLENLVVRMDEPGEDGTHSYAVVAGGRRLKAMQALVEDQVLDAEHPVPCQLRSGDAESGGGLATAPPAPPPHSSPAHRPRSPARRPTPVRDGRAGGAPACDARRG